MFDRRLVKDIGFAALIAFPAVLPMSPTPRSPEARSAAEGQALLADAAATAARVDAVGGASAQGRS